MIPRSATSFALATAERGLIPDAVVRAGIRSLCRRRLASERERVAGGDPVAIIRPELQGSAVAEDTDKANAQHYEVPAGFYELVLGPRLKYSSGYWGEGVEDLSAAEEAALRISCEHADLADGQDILELGCGWGSLTLWMAERLPGARITAVSNSASQAEFIRARLAAIDRSDVRIVTADMNAFDPGGTFDRIVSVEMFEHMRNWELLLGRVGSWLRPEGRFFAHVFCHRSIPYLFEDAAEDDWMARHFFSGGLMPSAAAIPLFGWPAMSPSRTWRSRSDRLASRAVTSAKSPPPPSSVCASAA